MKRFFQTLWLPVAAVCLLILASCSYLKTAPPLSAGGLKIDEISGMYDCKSPHYSGMTIINKTGSIYQLWWIIGKDQFYGVGIREGDTLSATWLSPDGRYGLVVYRIEAGPKLTGRYTMFPSNGTLQEEVLTFRRASGDSVL